MSSKVATRAGWMRVRFGDVVRLSTERCTDPAAVGIDRYVGLEHLEPGDLRVRAWGDVADGVTFTNRFRAGQVLFGKRRAYQRKVAVAEFDGICSSDIYVFEPADERLLPELLPFICQTDGFFEHAVTTSAGSLSPRTNWTSLADYEFELPPTAEQRRICRIARLADETHAHTSALASANATVATAYLEREIGPLFNDAQAGTSHLAPTILTIEELCVDNAPICYGIVQVGAHIDGGIPTLAIHSFRTLREVHHTSQDIEAKYSRSRIREGDLLVSVKGTVGLIATVPNGFTGNISRDLARIRLDNSRILNDWLLAIWATPSFQRRLKSLVVGTTRAELSIATLRSIRVPVPSIPNQVEICRKWLGFRNSHAAALERQSASKHFRTKLLARAFA